jgi:hypothetical protein
MRLASDETLDSGPRISVESMQKGEVRLAMSMLLQEFAEIDFTKSYGAPPAHDYTGLNTPSVWRSARSQAAAKVDALASNGMDEIEIPAFLRKQAD